MQFSKSIVLPESFLHDSIMCGIVADIDWDGTNEIVLGPYGKRLLIYKHRTTGSLGMIMCVCIHALDLFIEDIGTFDLIWTRQFAYPLHCLLYEDITKDGLKEMVALSTAGVHVLQV